MADLPHILSIPEELIIKIFEFCDVQSLGRLARTCRKFRYLVNTEDSFWRNKYAKLIGSNMFSRQMQLRSKPFLSYRRRCEVSIRWRKGLCMRRTVVRYGMCLPWLCMDRDYLICSKERLMVQYPRKNDGNVSFHNVVDFVPHTDDVSRFVINGNEVVTASRDGTLGRWRKGNFRSVHSFIAHNSDILCVDAKEDIIVSGSRNSVVKVWRATPNDTILAREIDMDVRVLSVAIMPTNRYYVVGLSGTNNIHPLQLFDFERDVPVTNLGLTFRRGAGIMYICPENDYTFLCCGYDTTVKLWDIRSPEKFKSSWMDPYDNGIYCVKTDHNVTIVSGASRSALVHVWDKRKPGQEFVSFLHPVPDFNSPCYSVAFDASHIFAAYDRAVLQYSYL